MDHRIPPEHAIDALLHTEARALDTARRARMLRRRVARLQAEGHHALPEDEARELARLRMEAACWEWDVEMWRAVIVRGDAE